MVHMAILASAKVATLLGCPGPMTPLSCWCDSWYAVCETSTANAALNGVSSSLMSSNFCLRMKFERFCWFVHRIERSVKVVSHRQMLAMRSVFPQPGGPWITCCLTPCASILAVDTMYGPSTPMPCRSLFAMAQHPVAPACR